jgi:peptide deformylase
MSVRDIIRLGDPVLREPAAPVDAEEISEPELQHLVDDLFETMEAAGGVGLAAPQVGVGLQLFVYGVQSEGDDAVPARVVINPLLTPEAGEAIHDWEGCLSIPGLRGLVPRHPAVRVQGLDRAGEPLDYVASGFEARIVQHEHDHLNGVMFLDRMRDLRSLCFEEEWHRFVESSDPMGHTAVG